jgi:hypothetical protein
LRAPPCSRQRRPHAVPRRPTTNAGPEALVSSSPECSSSLPGQLIRLASRTAPRRGTLGCKDVEIVVARAACDRTIRRSSNGPTIQAFRPVSVATCYGFFWASNRLDSRRRNR